MGVLRQKCVPNYELISNQYNLSNKGFNLSYESYLKHIDNEGMSTNSLNSH